MIINWNWMAEIWGHDAWTFGEFIFVNDKAKNDQPLILHEKVHVKQWRRNLYIFFPIRYVYYKLKYGYKNNPFEIEAYRESGHPFGGLK